MSDPLFIQVYGPLLFTKISCSLRPITNQMGTTGSQWIYMKKIKQLVTQSNLFTNQNLSIISHANDVMKHKFENQNNGII